MTTYNRTLASSNNEFFDLLAYADELPSPYITAEIASSTAWRIDTILVSQARAVLKFVKEELFNRGGFESMAEINAALADAEFAEQNFNEIGSSVTGPIEMIRALNAQRDQWHDFATRTVPMVSDYRGMAMVYTDPGIEAAFHKEPALRVSETAQRRLHVRSQRIAQALGAAELAEQHYQRSIQRKEDQNKRIGTLLKDSAPIAAFMFNLVLRTDPIGAAQRDKDFWKLPIEAQRLLIDNASNAAMRADERAADDRNMSETEYDIISLTAIKTMTELKKVLTAPRFTARQHEPAQV